VVNPACPAPNDLLYRTGDRGVYLPDGTLLILGRLDDQIKIRGVRVEPNEVAAVIAQHTAVEASYVLARKDQSGQAALVAYVVPRQPGSPATDLQAFLRQRLPAAMVPGAVVVLDHLPLTPNGKVDRRALPEPTWETSGLGPIEAPRNEVEEVVAGIWQQVLGVNRLDIHRHFFEVGGHSLLATRVMARLRDAFRCDLPLRLLFEAPTIAQLSEALLAGPQGARVEKIAKVLVRLSRLSDEEVAATLAQKEDRTP
jgi:acyl carrier protein